MTKQDLLDFARIYVFATANDHLLHSSLNGEIAVVCHRTQIARPKPSVVGQRLSRCFRIIEVALGYATSPSPNFTQCADRHSFAALRIGHFDFDLRHGPPDSQRPTRSRLILARMSDIRRGFRLPESNAHPDAKGILDPPYKLRRDRRPAERCESPGTQVEGGQLRVLENTN